MRTRLTTWICPFVCWMRRYKEYNKNYSNRNHLIIGLIGTSIGFHQSWSQWYLKKKMSKVENRCLPDIEPNSLEWLLLFKLVLLLLSMIGATRLCADFSKISWSFLQYNDPPSRNANSSPVEKNKTEKYSYFSKSMQLEVGSLNRLESKTNKTLTW